MHPLQTPSAIHAIEQMASTHLGRRWVAEGFTDLNDRASHPCGILLGEPFSVFAKFAPAQEQFAAELRGLTLLRQRGPVPVAVPVAPAPVAVDGGWLLLLEAVAEVPAAARTAAQWRSIGHALARLHQVRGEQFGLPDFDGFFGPLPQDNRPVASGSWADFYAERRLLPRLRSAVDSGALPAPLARGVERLVPRLPDLCGPEPGAALLHGDAQQNNLLTTAGAAVFVDAAPYYGHPELDLALVDYFAPVPRALFEAYGEVCPIAADFTERRELWRLHGYLAVVAVDGRSAFGRPFLARIAAVLAATL
jgi:fructosamine-3-kinase